MIKICLAIPLNESVVADLKTTNGQMNSNALITNLFSKLNRMIYKTLMKVKEIRTA